MTRADLLSLADRVEREAPSLALDDAVARATGVTENFLRVGRIPYTTNLDAAASLVPPENTWAVGDNLALRKRATCGRLGRFGQDCMGEAKTPAAALTAAALRALAQEAGDE